MSPSLDVAVSAGLVDHEKPTRGSDSAIHVRHRGIDRAVDAGNRGMQLQRGSATNFGTHFGTGCGDDLTDSDVLPRSDHAANLNTFTDRGNIVTD